MNIQQPSVGGAITDAAFATGANSNTANIGIRTLIGIASGYGVLGANVADYFSSPSQNVSDVDFSLNLDGTDLYYSSFGGQLDGLGARSWWLGQFREEFEFDYSYNGSNILSISPNAYVDLEGLSPKWVRVTFSPVGGLCNFYYSLQNTHDINSVSWTQVGTEVTGDTGVLFNGGAIKIGGGINDDYTPGKIYSASFSSAIGGDPQWKFDALDYKGGSTLVSSLTNEVWTLNGGATIQTFPTNVIDWQNKKLLKDWTAVTQPVDTNTSGIATTAFVIGQGYLKIADGEYLARTAGSSNFSAMIGVNTFTGSTVSQIVTLPAPTGRGAIYFKNQSSVSVTVASASGNQIFTASAQSGVTVLSGDSLILFPDGKFWNK